MSDPYTPPSSQEEHPGTPVSNKSITLRNIGALGMGIQLVRILWGALWNPNDFPLSTTLPVALMGSLFLGIFIYGFLRGGRKFHIAIAIILGLAIASRISSLWYIVPVQEPGEWNPWLTFALQTSPPALAFLCATALYLRAKRALAAS